MSPAAQNPSSQVATPLPGVSNPGSLVSSSDTTAAISVVGNNGSPPSSSSQPPSNPAASVLAPGGTLDDTGCIAMNRVIKCDRCTKDS